MSHHETGVSTEKRQYYSSSQGPFHHAGNIYLFYGGGDRGTVVETILRSLRYDDALVTVHGEPGSGKTLMGLVLADRLQHRYNVIRYDYDRLSPALLLRHLLIETNPQQSHLIPPDSETRASDPDCLQQATASLHQGLQQRPPGDKPYVLIVDCNAETDAATLTLLQDLTRLRRGERPAMHVVLFRRIDADSARAVNGHSGVNQPENHYWLRRLNLAEINEYLHHHMLLFDFNRRDMFSREMAYFIADRSEGVFRQINTLARNAFMLANIDNAGEVSMSHLLMAGLPPRPPGDARGPFLSRHRRLVVALLGLGVVASLAGGLTLLV